MAKGNVVSVKVDESKDQLTIVFKLRRPPTESKTGKTLLYACTEGSEITDTVINGKQLQVNCNAYVYKEDKKQ